MAERASLGVIGTRERAATKMKDVLRSLFLPVDPYDGDQIAEFTTDAARQLGAAQKATAIAAAAGQKLLLSAMGVNVKARPSAPVDVRAAGATFTAAGVELDRGGVVVHYDGQEPVHLSAKDMTTVEVLNRPFRKMRYLESQGATREQALQAGIVRLDSTIDANLMLSQRLAESEVINAAANLAGSPVVGMRRIIHPELSLTGTCGLCIAASDRLYTVRELLPMHRLCKCTSCAVTEEFDPADELNAVDLRRLYRDAGGTSRAHLKRTRYKQDDHGELGPTLKPERKYRPSGKKAEGGSGTGSVLDETPAEIARRQLPLFEANLAKLRADGLGDDSAQVKYHEQQIARYRERIAAEGQLSGSGTRSKAGAAAVTGMGVDPKQPETAAGRSGGGGNGNGGGGGVSSADGDGNNPQKALAVVKALAQDAEPDASAFVRAVASDTGGTVERFGSRFKTDASILEKLDRFKRPRPPYYRLDKFNDALRYTLVYPESGYWNSTREIVAQIEQSGFTVEADPAGWRANYRGLNLTLKDSAGRMFEVQLHTPDSLRASEESHGLYEEMRKLPRRDPRKAVLEAQIAAVYASVPWPDGVPHV